MGNSHKTLKKEAKSETTTPERLKQLADRNNQLAKIVAANPTAPSELLKELASKKSLPVQKALVSNPNTPTEILLTPGANILKFLAKDANPVVRAAAKANLGIL